MTALRAFEALRGTERERVRQALRRLAVDVARPGRIGGKASKTIHGPEGSFHRLRVGDLRIMYDVITDDRVVLILGIVHRGDLERWLRAR